MAPGSVGAIERLLPVSSGVPTSRTVSWFPSPATSNGACRFPALRSPARFARRFMGRSRLEVLSILIISPASTPHPPITSVFLFLYILRLRSCRLPSVFIRRPCLPSLPEEYETAGSLRSLGVTPVHRYCRPFRHLLAFLPFPGSAGYRSDLLQSISLWDEEGFSSCLTCPCTVLSLPPRRSVMSHRSARAMSCCLRPAAGSSASGSIFFFEATC